MSAGESLQIDNTNTRNSRLEAVTVNGNIDLRAATLRMKDVVVNGRVSLDNLIPNVVQSPASLAFEGTQTLGGNAEIVSRYSGGSFNALEMQAAGELTLGAGVRVHGAGLNLGGSVQFGQPMSKLTNLGTIEADTGTVQVVAPVFENRGVAAASGGTARTQRPGSAVRERRRVGGATPLAGRSPG